MGSKATTSLAYFLVLNLIFFTLVNACGDCPKPKQHPPPPPNCPPPPKTPRTPVPPSPKPKGKCPLDTLKLSVCAELIPIVGVVLGSTKPCCSLLEGLANLDAALCLCTAIKANVLGINLNIPIALSAILNNCGKYVPSGFQCA